MPRMTGVEHRYAVCIRPIASPAGSSATGQGLNRAVSLWSELENCLFGGALEIDNNLIENTFRPLALGRKNSLFAAVRDAAIDIAMYRSFFATCRLQGIDRRR